MFVYNTATNTTTALAAMPSIVDQYGMTLLGNGDILVCGGTSPDWTATCLQYSSARNIWLTTFPPLPIAMSDFPMITLHSDGRPYVFGGLITNNIPLNTVYTFDTTNAWIPRTPMARTLWNHNAVALDTNTALVCGGLTIFNPSSAISQCYAYTISICGHEMLLLRV